MLYNVTTKIISCIKKDLLHTITNNHLWLSEDKMQYISLLDNDIEQVIDKYFLNIFYLIKIIVMFFVSLTYLISVDIKLSFIILLFGFISVNLPQIFVKKNRFIKKDFLRENSNFLVSLKELLYGMETIKLFSLEKLYLTKNEQENNKLERSRANMLYYDSLIEATGSLTGFLVHALTVLYAGYMSYLGHISVGTVLAVMQIMNHVITPLSTGSAVYSQIKSVEPINKKILDLIYNNISEIQMINYDCSVHKIKIENLSFRYNDLKSNALEDISLSFEAGKKYAIIGTSGCGKSTLIKILSGLLNDYNGSIFVNDIDLKNIAPCSWVKKISVVQQDTFLFDGSIKYNICFNENVDLIKFNHIIQMSQLEEFIHYQENGVETCVGENGANISGGEKQRISLARSFMKDSEILLIDEGTSALDCSTSEKIHKMILNSDCMVLSSIHHYSEDSLSKYDKILLLEKGKIVDFGSFEELAYLLSESVMSNERNLSNELTAIPNNF
jgi:ATP-binding cassette subfamily B protein